jgi:hypothetical protein
VGVRAPRGKGGPFRGANAAAEGWALHIWDAGVAGLAPRGGVGTGPRAHRGRDGFAVVIWGGNRGEEGGVRRGDSSRVEEREKVREGTSEMGEVVVLLMVGEGARA